MIRKLGPFILFLLVKIIHANVRSEILTNVSEAISSTVLVPTGTGSVTSPSNTKFKNRSLLEVLPINSSLPLLICFPEDEEDYQPVYVLSHMTCRRKGFMTFTSIEAKQPISNRTNINPKSIPCNRQERSAYQCNGMGLYSEMCPRVTEVLCGACNGTINGFSGVIHSPGFPHASLADVTCEWNIMVPEHHSILLHFEHFDAINTTHAELPCRLHRPYILIMYGVQSKVTVHRYCHLSLVKNLSIPFHTVKIIVFTGLEVNRTRRSENELGVAISFEASVPPEDDNGSPVKIVSFVLMGVLFISCIIICHYIQKHKICDYIAKDGGSSTRYLAHPEQHPHGVHHLYTRKPTNENVKLNKTFQNDCANAEKGNLLQNPKILIRPKKDIHRSLSMFETSTTYTPNFTSLDKECHPPPSHNRLHFLHSYHGVEDPNRLSVSSALLYDYTCFQSSRHASSDTCIEKERTKSEHHMSTL